MNINKAPWNPFSWMFEWIFSNHLALTKLLFPRRTSKENQREEWAFFWLWCVYSDIFLLFSHRVLISSKSPSSTQLMDLVHCFGSNLALRKLTSYSHTVAHFLLACLFLIPSKQNFHWESAEKAKKCLLAVWLHVSLRTISKPKVNYHSKFKKKTKKKP